MFQAAAIENHKASVPSLAEFSCLDSTIHLSTRDGLEALHKSDGSQKKSPLSRESPYRLLLRRELKPCDATVGYILPTIH